MAIAPGLSHLEFYKLQWFRESPGDHRLPYLLEISGPNSSPRIGAKLISSEAPFEQIRWASFTVKYFNVSIFYFLSPIRSFVFAHVKSKVSGQRIAPSSYLAPFRRHPCDIAGAWVTALCLFWFSIWVTAFWLKNLLCIKQLACKVSLSRSHSTRDRTLHWVWNKHWSILMTIKINRLIIRYLTINEWGWVSCEELWRSKRVLSGHVMG